MTTEQQTNVYPTLPSAPRIIEMKDVQDISADDLQMIAKSYMAEFVTENLDPLIQDLRQAASEFKTELKVEENIIKMVQYLKTYDKFNGIQIQEGKLVWTTNEGQCQPLENNTKLLKNLPSTKELKPVSREEATAMYNYMKKGTVICRLFGGWFMGMVVKKPQSGDKKIHTLYEDKDKRCWTNKEDCITDAMKGRWILLK